MNNNALSIKTRFAFFGSYEAVAEACMQIWRAIGINEMSSIGIEAIDAKAAPGLYEFVGDCGNITGLEASFCEAISKCCPSTMVGVSVSMDVHNGSPKHCYWGTSAHINGVEVFGGITGSLPSSLPADIVALLDDSHGAGALPRTSIPRLHEYGLERMRRMAVDRLYVSAAAPSESIRSDGFPRWNLLTHSINSLGLDGFSQVLDAVGSTLPAHIELSHQAALASSNGTASWVDTLFCGTRTPASDVDAAARAPYSTKEVSTWAERRAGVLQYVGDAQDSDDLASSLAYSLSSPDITFQDDIHPLPWLVAHGAPDAASSAGLRKILVRADTHTIGYNDDVVGQAYRAAMACGYSADSLQLLLRMKQSPGLIVSKSLLMSTRPEAEQVAVAGNLMEGFRAVHSTIKDFPDELQRAFLDGSECVAQVFEAKRTEECMSNAINDWKTSAHTPSSAGVTVVTKRNRRLAL